ncbi:type II secretion system F family protein [Bordetella sp. BOR01]|uniref:type II secretion system F family protein n=1 Tax=Bordetella sp. BOR01 TaxID=2854779 RepID=UPI001C45F2FE|nr:type II secretion system F family protein [Bordetella sp. BOR01]MBV7482550.1 type II secretion system F family protein [Bordetella sp. BOR01]
MIWLAIAMSTACTALLAWRVQAWFGPALQHYRQVYTQDAGIKLGEVFLFIDPAQLWLGAMLLAATAGLLTFALSGNAVLGSIAAVIAARLPRKLVERLRSRRLARFEQQLPGALLALASALRAGVGVSTALRHIVDHSPAPLAQEFGLMLREQRLGVSFGAALQNLSQRMPAEATALVVAALRVASNTGGNLAETLDGIARTLRERLQLQGKVRALTAQGRLQAWIVGALPLLLLAVLDGMEPDAMAVLWHTPLGWATLAVVATLETAGVLLIRRIVDIDI